MALGGTELRTYWFAVLSLVVAFVLVGTAQAQGPQIYLTGPVAQQLTEGRSYDISWSSSGVSSVSISADGDLISAPDSPRGRFNGVIADGIDANAGSVRWQAPFLDTMRFTVTIRGYDDTGQQIAEDKQDYLFRPEFLDTRTADGIYVDLRDPKRQRLYRLHGNVVTHAFLTSGARTQIFLPRHQDSSTPHNHVGVFRVLGKDPMYWSNEYQVWMTSALRFWKGHFIHGTYPDQYPLLGTPASSGCIRLHRADAKVLYDLTPVGTRVEILGG
jgi:hypothetical protein